MQLQGGGPIKIGACEDTFRRHRNLQTGCPYQIDLVCEISTNYFAEAFLHDHQKAFRIRGEWFEPNAALVEIITHIKEHGSFPERVAQELENLWEIRESLKRRAMNYQTDAKQKSAG